MATNEERKKLVEEVTESLQPMQDFKPNSIARVEDLGKKLNFQEGVEDVIRIVELFRQVALDVLPELSVKRLNVVKQQADAQYNLLQQMLKFAVTEQNPKQTRDNLLQQLQGAYDTVFEQLWPAIAYSVRRSTDFARMEREARAAIQAIEDRTSKMEEALKQRQQDADAALEAIRQVAAEHGVSQQAVSFKEEAEEHEKEAGKWLKLTACITGFLFLCAVATLFIHKIPWLAPSNSFEAVQLVVSKVLVFGTISYFLVLSARNFMAHRHNAVVNKHRQNSLVTYRALVEAAGDQANRDIVLGRAADSVFGAQATGFAKAAGEEGKAMSMVNVNPSLLKSSGGG